MGKKRDLIRVTILNWDKYQNNRKGPNGDVKTYPWFKFYNKMMHDPIIAQMNPSEFKVWVTLMCTSNEVGQSSITVDTDFMSRLCGVRAEFVHSCILHLEKNHIVTTNSDVLEEKREEKKRREEKRVPTGSQTTAAGPPEIDSSKEQNKRVNDAYCQSYFDRYKVQPVSNAKHNSAVAQLVKRLGVDDAISVVKFFLRHNESYYVRNTHTIGHCLKDCETLRTQMLKGVSITRGKMKHFEREQEHQDMLDLIERENHEPTATN